jgi:hypothetical protein
MTVRSIHGVIGMTPIRIMRPQPRRNRLGDLNYETRKAELSTIAVDLPALGEGRHRLRLIAVDGRWAI